VSFCLSFHLVLLGPTGAYWLDDPPDLSCKDDIRQHAVDDPLLSCNRCTPLGGRRVRGRPGRCYRSSRLTSTVSTTENNTMNRQPSPPPSGRTSTFPKRMPSTDRRRAPQATAPAAVLWDRALNPDLELHSTSACELCLPCLIIRTIGRDPSGSVQIDEASNVSRPDRSGADQSDVEHQDTDLAVGGSNPSRRATISAAQRPCEGIADRSRVARRRRSPSERLRPPATNGRYLPWWLQSRCR
jgi:hypothetical protein